jgi:hypothetical protein
VGNLPSSRTSPVTHCSNVTSARTADRPPSPVLTNINGARNANRAHAAAGSVAVPRLSASKKGRHRRWSRPNHARSRDDCHPVGAPHNHGDVAEIATRTGPSR